MHVTTVLKGQRAGVATIAPEAKMTQAAALLDDSRPGILVVCEPGGAVVGTMSERDIVKGIRAHGERTCSLEVRAVMNRDRVTCRPAASPEDVRRMMNERQRRDLPVVEDGRLVGLVNIDEMLFLLFDEAKLEEEALRD